MKKEKEQQIQVGGQAVIEGVMMRSPDYFTVAVRKPDGEIALQKKAYQSLSKRFKILGWPFIRGGVTLIESLVLGVKALNFSSAMAMTEEEAEKTKSKESDSKWTNLMTGGTVLFSLVIGFALFFYLPLMLTEWTGVKGGILFNVIDGGIRLVIFLAYLILISLWKEIRRIFEYHGAEHKSIFAFEAGKSLTLENVRGYTTHHPRCGTSFLLIVMVVSIIVFVFLGRPETIGDRLIRFLFIPLIGGISYEIIRLSSKKWGSAIARYLVAPGLWMQKITTQEPSDDQLEVALVALKAALNQPVDIKVETVS